MMGRDYIWIYYHEIQGENSKTSKGKIYITYERTKIR